MKTICSLIIKTNLVNDCRSLLVLYSLMSPVEGGATSIAACKDKQVGDSCLKACCNNKPSGKCCTRSKASSKYEFYFLIYFVYYFFSDVRWFLGRRCASSERIGLSNELENWFYIFNDW